jgi:hypothetical protein
MWLLEKLWIWVLSNFKHNKNNLMKKVVNNRKNKIKNNRKNKNCLLIWEKRFNRKEI